MPNPERLVTPDAFDAHPAPAHVRYWLSAEAEADSVCRVLNLFALQSLMPHEVYVRQRGDLLDMEIAVSGLAAPRAQLIARKIRNLVCVEDASVRCQPLLSEACG
ncbi:hypothetical protein G7Z99_08220 [Pseudomonas entomophila]|uniref:hypothetical protein n=1 Tax=Pseudomonas entomophila TaxID=312306 RepID=UPI0015E37365|nr:hypothetical protein [Pseudomonas entomophila]MBA1189031.1 hypothetical protein [Pseudomonas entomophila]